MTQGCSRYFKQTFEVRSLTSCHDRCKCSNPQGKIEEKQVRRFLPCTFITQP